MSNKNSLSVISPSDNAQKAQYEEWLQETQQLLQMQQKFLEEKIGAHRKAKKALCAKQRTAKKAGREFAEEDAEQLKHVTEQQSVVQKQLEQVNAAEGTLSFTFFHQHFLSPLHYALNSTLKLPLLGELCFEPLSKMLILSSVIQTSFKCSL